MIEKLLTELEEEEEDNRTKKRIIELKADLTKIAEDKKERERVKMEYVG